MPGNQAFELSEEYMELVNIHNPKFILTNPDKRGEFVQKALLTLCQNYALESENYSTGDKVPLIVEEDYELKICTDLERVDETSKRKDLGKILLRENTKGPLELKKASVNFLGPSEIGIRLENVDYHIIFAGKRTSSSFYPFHLRKVDAINLRSPSQKDMSILEQRKNPLLFLGANRERAIIEVNGASWFCNYSQAEESSQ